MSKFFESFPDTFYRFGNSETPVLFNNLSVYIDVVDQVKSSIEYYTPYTIQPQDRPDVLSQRLYGTPDYHWTFFLMNDNLRKGGWPVTNQVLEEKVKEKFDSWVLTTEDEVADIFLVGERVEGKQSGAVGTVVNRRLSLGQIIVQSTNGLDFSREQIVGGDTLAEQQARTAVVFSALREYNSTVNWLDSNGEIVDIDPYNQDVDRTQNYFNENITGLTRETVLEQQIALNEDLKQIFVLKKDVIGQVVTEFKKLL